VNWCAKIFIHFLFLQFQSEANSYFPVVGNGRQDGHPKVTRILEEEDKADDDDNEDVEKSDERTKQNSRKMKK
jgi:hypothetical protein